MAKKKHKHPRMAAMGRGIGMKSSAMALGAGAVAGFGAGELATRFEMMRKAWWVTPLVVAVGGHVGKGKWPKYRDAWDGLLGGAGTMAYYNYKLAQAGASASGGTQGVQETSAVDDADYVETYRQLASGTGAVQESGGRSRSNVMGLQY